MLLFEWKKRNINRLYFFCFYSPNFLIFHYLTIKYIDSLDVLFILSIVMVYNYLNCLFSSQRLKDIGFIFHNTISIFLNLSLYFLIYYSAINGYYYIYIFSIFSFFIFIVFLLICPSKFIGKGR